MEATILENESCNNSFDALSFERKLVEIVEELRLRRSLEEENEKTVKSLMDEKHKAELDWDDQHQRHLREKNDLEQQISLLKRKLEDKVCGLDDEKIKQQLINKTYSEEIKLLKEEIRNANSEKLKFIKRIQELEGQSKLHINFQKTIVDQIAEIRKRTKAVGEECKELVNNQTKMVENVTEAKKYLKEIELRIDHLIRVVSIIEAKNKELKKDLVAARCEITMLKNSTLSTGQIIQDNTELKKKTMSNFLESNKLLCEMMNKYADAQEKEKEMNIKIETHESEAVMLKQRVGELQNELSKNKENCNFNEKHSLMKNSVETQTSNENHSEGILVAAGISESVTDNCNSLNTSSATNTECINVTKKDHNTDTGIEKRLISSSMCNLAVFKSVSETVTFKTIMKRKFDLIDEDEVQPPTKKLLSDMTCLGTETKWAIENQEHRKFQSFMDDEKSIPSSINSTDGFEQSQEKQVIEEFNKSVNADNMVKVTDNVQDGEVESIDLINVQMNLKELKVCDAEVLGPKELKFCNQKEEK
ncbi:uncharacterized protein CDAR_229431 [Caerostris darwini]|uniref:Coiled-coil domain-containing protein 73 n=1 Tax=Caerostris darwini TaxID=1538125 RepID=A0AAV4Q1Q8_9ARAC|nr:uncharacterized protein CDAR_229431 [Caerostris darwini]